jgi:NAD(P)-dependent dehydrogenase (short-subunit alcohol dehydrogenase family)
MSMDRVTVSWNEAGISENPLRSIVRGGFAVLDRPYLGVVNGARIWGNVRDGIPAPRLLRSTMKDLKGKVACVTGGGRGIGLGMAKAFATAGMKVAVVDINEKSAREAAEGLGSTAAPFPLDVSDLDAWETTAQAIERTLGPVRVLCNNAGVTSVQSIFEDTPIERISAVEWNWMVSVNLNSAFYGLKTFLPRFKTTHEESHIVNTASMAGVVPLSAAITGGYTASKYAVVGLTEQLRLELVKFPQIGLSLLCPGTVQTKMQANAMEIAPHAATIQQKNAPSIHTIVTGMSPDRIGERVLQAIQTGEHYIFTHPEYLPLVRGYHHDIEQSFGPSTQPGHADLIPAWIPVHRP